MRVADWMSPDPTTVSATASAEAAAALLRYYHVRHLPVIDGDGQLIGMISDRDLVTGVVGNRSRVSPSHDDDVTVSEVMSQPVVTADPDDELDSAMRRMLTARVSALAVLDRSRRLVGVLTTTDGLLALLQLMPSGRDVA